ncbi:helix-turn-helix domain-containing protein [Streptomyces sp. NBC_00012]|uniref:helix-turn-helix domain-containing protein n=1 Tax=Streptomyces sp. NBC_00012 TaxID=2975621 RepID=UPI0038676427
MGRHETALDLSRPFADFAHQLRSLRAAAGLTYEQISFETGYSRSALCQAASGRALPSWPVVRAYVRACGGNEEHWRELRHNARHVNGPSGSNPCVHPVSVVWPDIESATSTAEFIRCMNLVKEMSGRSLRSLAVHSYRSRSSWGAMLNNEERLPALDAVRHFLNVCQVPRREQERWISIWMQLYKIQKAGTPDLPPAVEEPAETRQPPVPVQHPQERSGPVEAGSDAPPRRWRWPWFRSPSSLPALSD